MERTPAAVAELYAAEPAEFVATRTRLVAEARAAGDRDAARAIGACAKPVASAAAVNALVRTDPDGVTALLAIGATLRAAAEARDAVAVRAAQDERRHAVDALVKAARLTGATGEQLAATLTAAVLDGDAARAVASGRLVRPLEGDGFDPVDTTDAVALPELPGLLEVPAVGPHRRRPRAPRRDAQDDRAERARRERLAERAERARRAADDAAHTAATARSAADRARRRRDVAAAALADAERALAEAEAAASAADAAQHEAEQSATEAAAAAR